jgi:uracil-DNA glycosylase
MVGGSRKDPCRVASTVTTDEIYERYLRKAITEINRLSHEITQAADGAPTALPTGHPLASIFLLKYGPQAQELQEGVAFHGRAGNALIKSLQRLHVDPMEVYGTNCVKFAGCDLGLAGEWLRREVRIVEPKLVVVMGEDALEFLNGLGFPLASPVAPSAGGLQRFSPTIEALVVPDIDLSLDEAPAKTAFWNAFKTVGPWWAELPPY